jgi:hypothetical protein
VLKKPCITYGRLLRYCAVLLFFIFVAVLLPAESFAEYSDTIVIKIGSRFMTVNGIDKEIDPGRGTVSVLESGRTLVPIRAIAEEMGGIVSWDPKYSRVDIMLDDIHLKLWINQTLTMVNGNVEIMDVAARMENFRTLVPLRFVAENMGAQVSWNGKTSEAVIKFNKKPIPVPNQPQFSIIDRFDELEGNAGRVAFEIDSSQMIGEYSGFKLYFTNDQGQQDCLFIDTTDGTNGFYCSDTIGKTVDIAVTAVNRTVESPPQQIKFAMLGKVNFDKIWSERKIYNLEGAPSWYGISWLPVPGAAKYKVYISNNASDWQDFKSTGNLSKFHDIIVSDTYISTKENLDLPQELITTALGEYRYIVIFPVNDEGIPGLIPASYEMLISGETIKVEN